MVASRRSEPLASVFGSESLTVAPAMPESYPATTFVVSAVVLGAPPLTSSDGPAFTAVVEAAIAAARFPPHRPPSMTAHHDVNAAGVGRRATFVDDTLAAPRPQDGCSGAGRACKHGYVVADDDRIYVFPPAACPVGYGRLPRAPSFLANQVPVVHSGSRLRRPPLCGESFGTHLRTRHDRLVSFRFSRGGEP